jgi:hypothetical protein
MDCCKPYGNPTRAEVMVIGHDPRLQRGKAEAQYAFFLDLLQQSEPSSSSEKSKYALADSVYRYIRNLTGDKLSLDQMYFTNLCNEFLERTQNSGTIYIPDDLAYKGIQQIENVLSRGQFKVVVPMSLQVFYHLVRNGFIDDLDETLKYFLAQSQPISNASQKGVYKAAAPRSFLKVCGRTYYHGKTPVVPVVHVKQWQTMKKESLYNPLMEIGRAHV